jgi:hypothetical protein
MKHTILKNRFLLAISSMICLLLAPNKNIYAQSEAEIFRQEILDNKDYFPENKKQDFLEQDFGPLLTHAPGHSVVGFIGADYQRIFVKLISVIKDANQPDRYLVYGKSMVKGNVCDFQGFIQLEQVRKLKEMHFGVDGTWKDKGIRAQGMALAKYQFFENPSQKHVGIFEGVACMFWYLDQEGKLRYDDIELEISDGYRNNQFVGTWRGYGNATGKPCHWGDYRIPRSGKLDVGAGEFSPSSEYLAKGWQRYHDAYWGYSENAKKEEETEWWK